MKIKLSELRQIVKDLIAEQDAPPYKIAALNKTVQFYSDEKNTKSAFNLTITKTERINDRTHITTKEKGHFIFSCSENFVHKFANGSILKLYNREYILALKNVYCKAW